MHLASVALIVLLAAPEVHAADPEATRPPMADQLLAHAADLELTTQQINALHALRERTTGTLENLEERLRASEAQSSTAAGQDSLILMQEIGTLRVRSEAEALRVLDQAQREQWLRVQGRARP